MGQEYLAVNESLWVNTLYGGVAGASVSVATANNTSIPVTGRVVKVSATAATTSGSCTLANGNIDGQQITLINQSANNIVISGGMKGSAAATVSGSQGAIFTWSAGDTAWYVTKG